MTDAGPSDRIGRRVPRPTLAFIGMLLFGALALAPQSQAQPRERPGPPDHQVPGPAIEAERMRPPEGVGRARPGNGPRRPVPPALGRGGDQETLRYGSPREARLSPGPISEIGGDVRAGLDPTSGDPVYPGAVVLAARNGVIAEHEAYGDAVKYTDGTEPLPGDERVPMQKDTIFDLASVSKLFTSIAVMQLVEQESIELDASVARYLPEFAENGKADVTVEQLLTHTSGLPAWLPLYSEYETPEERIAAVYAAEPESDSGERYAYSDLNMITLGKIVEKVSGQSLDRYVADNITQPLGMEDTGYNPPSSERHRIAATEYQPYVGRGMVRGSVHDENAWSLGGVAGHAGVFGTATDLAILAQTVLNGGSYGGERILEPQTVQELLTNYNGEFPGKDHGPGFELYQHWYMDAMATPATAGHTGFTGTSLVINPLDDTFAILLTNRVHPSREGTSVNPYRRAVARDVARAVPVAPARGRESWFSGLGDGLDNTLSFPVRLPEGEKELGFDLWYDTEPESDYGTVEISTDGGESWEPLALSVSSAPPGRNTGGGEDVRDGRFSGYSGREWLRTSADLDGYEGDAVIRTRYRTDAASSGRGIYVDRLRVDGPRGPLFDERRSRDQRLIGASGWTPSAD